MLASLAIFAALSCDPSAFTTYVRPKGVTTAAIPEAAIPGAVERGQARRRIDADVASAMIGLREGYMQRLIWPLLVDGAGVAKFMGWGGSYTNVNFREGNHRVDGDSWLGEHFDDYCFGADCLGDDLRTPSNRVFASPRIVARTREVADYLISGFLSPGGTRANRAFPGGGYWCVPGIDHMALCKTGVEIDGEDGELIDFDGGAFLPLYRCIDDVSNPDNPTLISNTVDGCANAFYVGGNLYIRSPRGMFDGLAYGADVDESRCLGYSCSATNEQYGYDVRIGPKMSGLLCAAAPGLPTAASNLNSIAVNYKSPRIYWDRFALANALLGLTTDFVIPDARAADPTFYDWGERDLDEYQSYNHLRLVTKAETLDITSAFVATQMWTAVGSDDTNSPFYISLTYGETKAGSIAMHYDLDKFSGVCVGSTNLAFDVNVGANSIEGGFWGWSDDESEEGDNFTAIITATNDFAISALNDLKDRDGYADVDVSKVPVGTYGPECFRIENVERTPLIPGMDHDTVPAIVWTTDPAVTNVPDEVRGTAIKIFERFPAEGMRAVVSATHSVKSTGSFTFGNWSPVVSPNTNPKYITTNAHAYSHYNFMSTGMFPATSDLGKYIDFTAFSRISCLCTTNLNPYSDIYIHGGGGTNRTAIWRSYLTRHTVTPTSKNLTDAMIDDRRQTWMLINNVANEAMGWDQTGEELYSPWDTNSMACIDEDLTADTWQLLTNRTAILSFDKTPNIRLVVEEVTGDGSGDGEVKTKLGKWEIADGSSGEPPCRFVFYRRDSLTKKRRHSPYWLVYTYPSAHIKFRFPMMDGSASTWPEWDGNKEYEPGIGNSKE